MDRGLWITWYDLPEARREAYLAWCHLEYLPALLERPGILWAAHYASVERSERPVTTREHIAKRCTDPVVPTGDRYILLVGAGDPVVFGNPAPNAYNAALPAADREMLALRIGERMSLTTEITRVEGPAAKDYTEGMLPAPCLQVGSYNCTWQQEEEMHAWYTQWRMRAMATLPGCVRTRRLASVAGWAKHGVLYEFVSLEMRNEYFLKHELADPEMKAWSDRFVRNLMHAPRGSYLAKRLWAALA